MPVSLSSDVLPEMNEYERTSTTVVNAYTKPVTDAYLTRIDERMKARPSWQKAIVDWNDRQFLEAMQHYGREARSVTEKIWRDLET